MKCCWDGGEALCYGDCIVSICPEAAWSHLADPAAQVTVVSFGELLHGVTVMGDHLLSVPEEMEHLCVAPEQPGACHSCFCKGR